MSLSGILVCLLLLPIVFGIGELKLPEEIVGPIKVIEFMSDAVLAMTSSNDPNLQCVTAERSLLNLLRGEGAYTWHFQGDNGPEEGDYTVTYTLSMKPGHVNAIVNGDIAHPFDVKLEYSDYQTCLVGHFPYNGSQCMLWVTESASNSIPQECIDHFEEACGQGVITYSEELCG
ncbi:uncharacterized protein LOC144141458 [Haemaphysalis longicornis]